ncbi:unnamed protein product [Hanseniaspora opuntiae]
MSEKGESTHDEIFSEVESVQGLDLESNSDSSDDEGFINSVKKAADIQKQQKLEEEFDETRKNEETTSIVNNTGKDQNGDDDHSPIEKENGEEIEEEEDKEEEKEEEEETEEEEHSKDEENENDSGEENHEEPLDQKSEEKSLDISSNHIEKDPSEEIEKHISDSSQENSILEPTEPTETSTRIISPPIPPRNQENAGVDKVPEVPPRNNENSGANNVPEIPSRKLDKQPGSIHPSLPPRRVSSNPFEKYGKEAETKTQGGSPTRNSLIKIATSANGHASNKNPVPPSLKDELNNPKFLKNLKSIKSSDKLNLNGDPLGSSIKIDTIRENSEAVSKDFDLIVNRFQLNNKKRDVSDSGIKGDDDLREDFKKVYEKDISKKDLEEGQKEKLEFWNELITDYSRIIKQYPDKLERMVFTDGIPSDLRPFLWKFITQSNLKNLQNLYVNNVAIESTHKTQIEKDIMRTSFIPKDKEEMLKNVCIAYSNYDSDLGYTQGLCFIVTPILLTLDSEEETFSLLVKLMQDYDLRSFYTQDMPGLMLKLYQFDKLLQEFSPQVHAHLGQCGIISNMFVSQWFLSFFGYRFPYEFVIRIFDIILLEGLEALLKFALAAIIKNEQKILNLQFDELLEFLKGDLFNVYLEKDAKADVDSNEEKYNVTEFVHDAQGIKLMPITLNTITQEYLEISELKKSFNPLDKEISRLKIINRNQCDELLTVKSSFNLLKNDHELMTNELIRNRQKILELVDEVSEWKGKCAELERVSKNDHPDANLPTDLKEGLEQVLERNKKVMEINLELEHENESLKALVKSLEHSLIQQGESPKEGNKWKLFKR